MNTWVFDLDDECDAWSSLPWLLALKEKLPNLKVTLFTIPLESSYPHLLKLKQYDWIELALHGATHRINNEHNPREMQHWTSLTAACYFSFIDEFYGDIFVRGLKAPGWQISDDLYRTASNFGYWIMDQTYNDARRPEGMKYYCLNEEGNLHGHTWNCNGGVDNFIEDMINRGDFDKVWPEDEFKFVSEVVHD
jgi:peptidoglycan/xylan/chitin deacetylase (PgdA/CDA1 family)